MSDIILGKKSGGVIEQGYVFAPYIPVQNSAVVHGYNSKRTNRKRKINRIFDLGLNIKDEFSPNPISSRYSTKNISSNYYRTIEIKKTTL